MDASRFVQGLLADPGPRQARPWPTYGVLPVSEDISGVHFDPYAGLLGSVTRPFKYFGETVSGQRDFDPTSEEAVANAADLAGAVTLGSGAMEAPAGALRAGAARPSAVDRQAKMQADFQARLRQPGEVGGLLGTPHIPIAQGDMRISTRQPSSIMKSIEDPYSEHLSVGLPEFLADTNAAHNASLLADYPGFAHLREMSPADAAEGYVEQARGNMNYLYRNTPEIMRKRSPLWYDGAHEVSDALANRWGVARPQVSAGIAALSPQKDWFQNASLAERAGDIIFGPTSSVKMTPEMMAFANRPHSKQSPNFITSNQDVADLYRAIQGKSFSQLNDPDAQALWIRLYDEAHNPKAYRSITPEGEFGDFVRTGKGNTRNMAWGSINEISKAVQALTGNGTNAEIQGLLGGTHKVPSFYNNIEVPNDPRFGDVTADTHQVAAAQLRPLSGKSAAVSHNFGPGLAKKDQPEDWRPAKSSAITGLNGTYGLNAEATRRFASDVGLLPRAGQSVGWEPVRELFTDTFKRSPESAKIDEIWRAKDAGKLTLDEARDAVLRAAGGIGNPAWAKSSVKSIAPQRGSTYR